MRRILALLVLAGAPASAESFRLALIEPNPPHLSIAMSRPLERLIRGSTAAAALLDVMTLPGYYAEGDLRFRLPQPWVAESSGTAALLELGSEAALIYPPDPSLIAALRAAARDPATFRMPRSLHFSARETHIEFARDARGGQIVTAQPDPLQGEAARWRSTALAAYRLRWNGEERLVALLGRVYGGTGRLATALAREKAGPPALGVARGGIFDERPGYLGGRAMADALAGLGLRYSSVGSAEIRRWPLVEEYRAARPEGLRFVSANLVYSTAAARGLLPAFEVVELGGLKVAITGVTHPAAAKYLKRGGLGHARLLDPASAIEALVGRMRAQADVVVVLAALGEETRRVREIDGVDLVVGEDWGGADHADQPADARLAQSARRPFAPPLWTMRAWHAALSVLEVSLKRRPDAADWELVERHRPLDDTLPSAPGYPEFDPEPYGIDHSTGPALVPAARRIFPDGRPDDGEVAVGSRDFWSMAAGLLAEETGAELGLLKVEPLGVFVQDDAREGVIRSWLRSGEPLTHAVVTGARLRRLLDEADDQRKREAQGLPLGAALPFAYGGVGPGRTVHGVPLEPQGRYRVATSRLTADALGLDERTDDPEGRGVDDLVLAALRRRAGAEPASFRDWMLGRPVRETGVWKVNFRDVGLNLTNTKVVRDDAFRRVPNARIQGSDERQVGAVFKTDLEYLRGPYKWTNTLELEYARTRIRPRAGPTFTNTTANRIMALSMGTRRAGGIPVEWIARSWGPSLGAQFEGQFEAPPGVRRKKVYSALPGFEFYDGSFFRSLKLAGNVRRDEGREPPAIQGGVHLRAVFAREIGPKKALLQGEFFTDYFPRTKTDRAQDLRVEGDLNVRLRLPVYKQISIAPFVDLYFFQLKTVPVWGYSAMTGIKIGFSRLWKPQYERF